MIVQRIKPYRQPQFNSPTLSLNGTTATVNIPETNGDFAERLGIYLDDKLTVSAMAEIMTDNSFSYDLLNTLKQFEHIYRVSARIPKTDEIRASEESNAEEVGKLAALVATIDGEYLTLYNSHGFSNASDIDIYINGEYSKTISVEKETPSTQIKIALSEFTAGYNKFTALSKNVDDTRWISSALSNEVKHLSEDTLYLSVARNAMASGTAGNYAVFAGGLTYNSTGATGVVEAYDETLTHIATTDDLLQYEIDSGSKSANAGDYLVFKGAGAYCVFDENLTLQILSGDNTIDFFAGSIGNHAVFAGGRSGGVDLSTVVAIDSEFLSLTTITPLSVARRLAGSANTKNHLVFCGGVSSQSTSQSVDAYDEDLTLVIVEDMPYKEGRLQGTRAGNHAVFAGGGYYGDSADAFAYDEGLSFISVAALTEERGFHSAASCKGSAVFAGNAGDRYSDVVEIYSDELVKTNRNIPVAKTWVAMASINDLCLIAGGRYDKNGSEYTSNTVDVLLFD